MFKLTGTIKLINPTQQVTEKFSKRDFVVTETSSMYPQDILFQATQDKCALLDSFQPNELVEVSFNLRGREWTSPQGEIKYFNTIDAWRIERVTQNAGIPSGGPSPMAINNVAPAPQPISQTSGAITSNDDEDDLPF
jgi:hypothetical protein